MIATVLLCVFFVVSLAMSLVVTQKTLWTCRAMSVVVGALDERMKLAIATLL